MVPTPDAETEGLLSRAADGDVAAVNDLLGRHRGRLEQMVAVRMDQRHKPQWKLVARRTSGASQDGLGAVAGKLPRGARDATPGATLDQRDRDRR